MQSSNLNIKKKKYHKVTPYLIVILSFTIVIMVGTFLLSLPISCKDNSSMGLVNAFFMTVSASCVTGLTVIANVGATLSIFGKIVIAILIEIGGLSFLTFAFFVLIILGKKVGVSSRFLMKEALNQNTTSDIMKLVKRIVFISLSIQFVGWIINCFILFKYYPNFFECIGISAFHTISSFNNAGFDIFGYDTSMIPFQTDIALNVVTMILIVIGGLGFIVLVDIFRRKKNKTILDLSLHSKIVLVTTCVLLIIGTLLFKLTMNNNVSWLEAAFMSVSARTAGFSSIDLQAFMSGNPSYVIMIMLMFIGASPCSTGGGVKTTTVFTIFVSLFYIAIGKKPKAFNRALSNESIIKAFALVSFSLFYVIFIVFLVNVLEPSIALNDIIFEVVSAFGTVGLSLGITGSLGVFSKILIAITMFIGRLGPLTVISIWNTRWMQNTSEHVKYIEEKIIIG